MPQEDPGRWSVKELRAFLAARNDDSCAHATEKKELADHVRVSKKRSRAATRSVRRTDAFDEASQQDIVDTVRAGMVAKTGDAATGRGALARGARSLLGFKAGETVGERVRRELAKVLRAHPQAKFNRFLGRWYVPGGPGGRSQYLNLGVSEALRRMFAQKNLPEGLVALVEEE